MLVPGNRLSPAMRRRATLVGFVRVPMPVNPSSSPSDTSQVVHEPGTPVGDVSHYPVGYKTRKNPYAGRLHRFRTIKLTYSPSSDADSPESTIARYPASIAGVTDRQLWDTLWVRALDELRAGRVGCFRIYLGNRCLFSHTTGKRTVSYKYTKSAGSI